MNIYVSNVCNIRCPYCAAVGMMALTPKNKRFMTVRNFKRALAFLVRIGDDFCRFEGGEPTLHPQFAFLCDYALKRGFTVYLFTNGLFNKTIQRYLSQQQKRVKIIWNINNPDFYAADQWRRLLDNLEHVTPHQLSALGVNIYRADQDFLYIHRLLRRFNITNLRFVLTHPDATSQEAKYISAQQSSTIIACLKPFLVTLAREGIDAGFDCGFLPCQWDDRTYGFLMKHGFGDVQCRPCPGITSDLRLVHCFQTAGRHEIRHIDDVAAGQELDDLFSSLYADYDNVHLFERCEFCTIFKMGRCSLGCIAERRDITDAFVRHLLKDIARHPTKTNVMLLANEYLRNHDAVRYNALFRRHGLRVTRQEVSRFGRRFKILPPGRAKRQS